MSVLRKENPCWFPSFIAPLRLQSSLSRLSPILFSLNKCNFLDQNRSFLAADELLLLDRLVLSGYIESISVYSTEFHPRPTYYLEGQTITYDYSVLFEVGNTRGNLIVRPLVNRICSLVVTFISVFITVCISPRHGK